MVKKKECSCERCVGACENNPGWFTPAEAMKAMDAGFHNRLMLDWADYGDGKVFVIAPATYGKEGKKAFHPHWIDIFLFGDGKGICNFLKDGKCEIHNSGFKPLECRMVFCCAEKQPKKCYHKEAFRMWDTPEGRKVVKRWKELIKEDKKQKLKIAI